MTIRLISVVVPMLDEAGHVGRLVADLAAQDWAGELELIVADGGSTDGSVEELRSAAERHGVALTRARQPRALGLARPQRAASAARAAS